MVVEESVGMWDGATRTVRASRECFCHGGGQDYDAHVRVIGDAVKGGAVLAPEPVSVALVTAGETSTPTTE